ncbi:MAG: NAD(P)H oxidoreductase, partial [Deltaproteobacteria bacterium HGW-Deltaproteobacteria-1]
IVWHFPFYTYSAPALLKQWMDVVLEYGWAHGSTGNALKDKIAFVVLTAGGTRESYAANQHNQFTLCEFLRPFEQAANLCKMIYLPPFAVHGTHMLTDQQLAAYANAYRRLLRKLTTAEYDTASISRFEYLNDWLSNKG